MRPKTEPTTRPISPIFPGDVLNEIYAQYGPRLLELNVRSFLQARGKVNQGIRRTILEEPERFLAYNNGISCTVSEIGLDRLAGRMAEGIRSVKGFRSSTAARRPRRFTMPFAATRRIVSHIHVQAKVTVVDEDRPERDRSADLPLRE